MYLFRNFSWNSLLCSAENSLRNTGLCSNPTLLRDKWSRGYMERASQLPPQATKTNLFDENVLESTVR